ncbi:SPOR domain-containing protein [Salinisphaera sp. SPP-AMP-43]|uniref:SPOR domain-containing protein n=1 Tax=Salinisphaera sp. SPP-AMP-43 TaxID=3121288 RepID=UPI003C6DDD6D
MNDVMKKRLIGVAILVIIGVLAPLLLSRCMHSGGEDDGRGSMRVYNVQPDGEAEPADGSGNDAGDTGTDGQAQQASAANHTPTAQSRQPSADAVSPQSESEFSTPPVHGSSSDEQAAAQTPAEPAPKKQAQPSQSSASTRQSSSNEPQPSTERDRAESTSSDYGSSTVGNNAKSNRSQGGNASAAGTGLEKRQPKGWVVQIASFGKQDNAEALARQLQGQFKAFYTPGDVDGKTWYRVNVGPFDGEDAARATADRLKQQGRKTLVRHLR